jgi:hypothetical protein
MHLHGYKRRLHTATTDRIFTRIYYFKQKILRKQVPGIQLQLAFRTVLHTPLALAAHAVPIFALEYGRLHCILAQPTLQQLYSIPTVFQ